MVINEEKSSKKKNLIIKAIQRCKSLGSSYGHRKTTATNTSPSTTTTRITFRRSSTQGDKRKPEMPPEGCFNVYVGPTRERFVVRAEWANHPLFRALLEEAETVYGYAVGGPLELPCDVDIFTSVISEMDQEMVSSSPARCGFPVRSYGAGYQLLSPTRPALSTAARF